MMNRLWKFALIALVSIIVVIESGPSDARAGELRLPTVLGDSMVLQRDIPIRIWGWGDAGNPVTVTLGGVSETGTCGDDGRFDVSFPARSASTDPITLTVKSGDQAIQRSDILIGEVWVCSGQSNMAWPVDQANDADLEKLTANFPAMRIISIPNVAAREPQSTFKGTWEPVTPKSVGSFSAVGYFFGRRLHQTLNVPVGLIDNAWGGSAAEAWVPPETLQKAGKYVHLLKKWSDLETSYDHDAELAKHAKVHQQWVAGGRKGRAPRRPRNQLTGNHRPGNLYYGCLTPIIGYSIRGAIWYQGESNSGRSYQYRDLFPRMITQWREDWGQGDFAFYWVQLADFHNETEQPGESNWAELREAQTMTLKLPHTGQAVITDLGEASDIHPRNKQDVAKRLARLALNQDYAMDSLVAESPRYLKASFEDGRAVIDFQSVGGGLDTFDVPQLRGFAIAGEDKKFVHANAKIVDADTVEVFHPNVKNPIAVRYAWADNPVANVQNKEGLPLTPFRTDHFPGVTINNVK